MSECISSSTTTSLSGCGDFPTDIFLYSGNTNACSLLKIRTAPENGYKPDYLSYKIITTNDVFMSWEADPNLCFRIRTKFDANGNVVEANYGKIYGGLGFNHSFSYEKIKEPRVERMRFLYYVNTTSLDRNLEFDCDRNLKPKNSTLVDMP